MAQAQTVSGTIVGFFEDHGQAENAVSALRDAGFESKQIGVAHQAGSALPTSETSTGVGAGTGAGMAQRTGQEAEGLWGKVKGFFEGDAVEPYADEKQGGDLASREVTPGGQGYAAEDFKGTLQGMAVPEDRSRYFDHRFESASSGALVTVTAPGREVEAERILKSNGGDLGDASESYDYSARPAAARTEGMQNIQLLGEVLRVQKDRVSRGEVTLRKEVTTEMQTIQVPVTREELVIERHAAAGGTTATGTIGDTGEIRIPLTEERASVDKATFVREEVSVGKRAVEETRQISDEVRSEELVVDDQTKTVADRSR